MKSITHNEGGFTLIEIMMVVIIIGILAVLAIPRYQKYLLESKLSEVAVGIGEIKQGMEKYYNSHGLKYTGISGAFRNSSLQQILRIELGANENFIYDIDTLSANNQTGYRIRAILTDTGKTELGGGGDVETGDAVIFYFPKELNTDYTKDTWVKGWNDDDFFVVGHPNATAHGG